MYVCMLRVRLGLVLGRHPKINLFGLHYCVICCEVETKSVVCLIIDQFRSMKIQPKTIDLSTRLRGIITEIVGASYQNWSILLCINTDKEIDRR